MERVEVSQGTWSDMLTLLHASSETHRSENIRWFGVRAPQYQVLYEDGQPTAIRLMGTMLELRRETNA